MSVTDAPTFTPRKAPPHQRFDPTRVVGRMPPEEYIAFERQGDIRYEYIEGSVIDVSGDSLEHSRIAENTKRALGNALEAVDADCDVYGSDQKIYINEQLYRYPDGLIVCGETRVNQMEAVQNPLLILEVLSPSREREDRTDKFNDYQHIESLRHYILISQYRPRVTHFEKIAGGLWAIVGVHTDLSASLTLTLDGKAIAVPLYAIYRRIEFAEGNETNPDIQ